MCECLEYEDGEMHLCAMCASIWREYEASMSKSGPVVSMLTGLPVVLNSLMPEGSIFMHPRTFAGFHAPREGWDSPRWANDPFFGNVPPALPKEEKP